MPAVNVEALKRVPKLVWIVGGGIVVGYVLLKKSTGQPVAGAGSTGGVGAGTAAGDGSGQGIISSADLASFLAGEQSQQNDFLSNLVGLINDSAGSGGGGGGGTTGGTPPGGAPGAAGPPGPAGPPGATGTGITPTPVGGGGVTTGIVNTLNNFRISIVRGTLYNASGSTYGQVGHNVFDVHRSNVGGVWHYIITSGPFAGKYLTPGSLGTGYTITPVSTPPPSAPPPAPPQPPVGSTAAGTTVVPLRR